MIYVDRLSVPNPLDPNLVRLATERLRKFFRLPLSERSQRNPPFEMNIVRSDVVTAALRHLFSGKCAYCESRLEFGGADLGHFRPRSRAARSDGTVDIEHYWWLVYDWSNLYYVCQECNSHKATRFPTKKSRAVFDTPIEELRRERPLLVDPCSPNLEHHFYFEDTGEMVGKTEQGRATVALLALNRPNLLAARKHTALEVKRQCDRFLRLGFGGAPEPLDVLLQKMRAKTEFAGMLRQLIPRFIERNQKIAPSSEQSDLKRDFEDISDEYHQGAIWPARIEIRNFRTISSLDLEFRGGHQTDRTNDSEFRRQPWLAILGENGVGKSSLLRAIALTLMPDSERNALFPDAGKLVSSGSAKRKGYIRIFFDDRIEPYELHFRKNHADFIVKGSLPEMAVLGYGSVRMLPPPGAADQRFNVSVRNLFDHRSPLSNSERFLASPDKVGKKEFDLIAMNLKEILSLGETDRIKRHSGSLVATVGKRTHAIRELSDGYQSVMALAMDIMFHLSKRTFDMKAVEGLVLLDEIELHLHPRWKIQIVELLRKIFPRVRFIVSTHDPLCLHGLVEGELIMMYKEPQNHTTLATNLSIPEAGMRTDQILTGAWFGISSTLDRETLGLIEEHAQLLLMRDREEEQNQRIAIVESILRTRLGSYADTPIQRAALTAAAAIEREGLPTDPATLQQQVREKMRAILAMARDSENSSA